MKTIACSVFCFSCFSVSFGFAQVGLSGHLAADRGNPVVPGYFADPTIKKIGDTYYLYATTDGNGGGLGPSQVWTSKDFRHWTIQPMNWPTTRWYWAPDMTRGYDGRYYLYYSQPVELFGAVSDSPTGPWTPLVPEGKAFVPNYRIPGVITLDGQTFTDDDGKMYMFWGTWGIYPDHGCAVGLLNSDMKSFERVERIPNTVAKDFFEAPAMFKRNGTYYLLYSSGRCEDETYRVQYVKSKAGPFGPYEYPAGNPILATHPDGTIHGPGHNDVLQENGRAYIVYHRHNNPHSEGGFHRQVAADELHFDDRGDIKKIVPTHKGIGLLGKNTRPQHDLAFGKKATASSAYSDDFRASFAVDNNNGTLWRAANNEGSAWLTVDLGDAQSIRTVLLEMEYPTYAYRYAVEVSDDGAHWQMFADNRKNDRWASPIVEVGHAKARYVRLTVYDAQLVGLPRGLWNIKVYAEELAQRTVWSDPQPMPARPNDAEPVRIRLDAAAHNAGALFSQTEHTGSIKGRWRASSPLPVKNYQGRKAFYFDGTTRLESDFAVPEGQDGNASYTLSLWVNNPEIDRIEPLFSWSRPGHDLTLATVGFGSDPARGAVQHGGWADMSFPQMPEKDRWHHIVVTFDGYMERLYVDGKLAKAQNKMLFVRRADRFSIGGSAGDFFSGYLANLHMERRAWTAAEVARHFTENRADYRFALETADAALGPVEAFPVYGTDGADTLFCEDGRLAVFKGRIGLRAKRMEAPKLSKILQQPRFAVELDIVHEQDWKHVLLFRSDGKLRVVENGTEAASARLEDFFPLHDRTVHAIRAHGRPLNDIAIQSLYTDWMAMCDGRFVRHAIQADGVPHYMNRDHAFVAAKPVGPFVRYRFSHNGQRSEWLRAPHHAFRSDGSGGEIEVSVRDIYGNVGLPARFALSDDLPENVWEGSAKSPFWDGMRLPADRDSTALEIERAETGWRLASKGTKWDDPAWRGPFLYRELAGDFTVEVKIADLAGLSDRTRTSGEAGLMVQDAADPSAYLNNSILTGWNVGNLVRQVSASAHREKSTGNGLDFEPFLQVQRHGIRFHLRSSVDGKHWNDLPGSPFLCSQWAGKTLRVGIYQTANNDQKGYGLFGDFVVWK